MHRKFALGLMLLIFSLMAAFIACDKEKIVESTSVEYVHDIEYIQLPGDTILLIDTIFIGDSDTIYRTDTIVQINNTYDTVNTVQYVTDTITTVQYVYDTVNTGNTTVDTIITVQYVYDTVTETAYLIDTMYFAADTVYHTDTIVNVHFFYDTTYYVDTIYAQGSVDTVVVVNWVHDTVVVVDTVTTGGTSYPPDFSQAYAALQYFTDPVVFEAILSEFGVNGGYNLYSSAYMADITSPGSGIYDIYGLIDYWTPEFDSYYPFEFFWRMSYSGGDPANPNSWNMIEPPGQGTAPYPPGVNLNTNRDIPVKAEK